MLVTFTTFAFLAFTSLAIAQNATVRLNFNCSSLVKQYNGRDTPMGTWTELASPPLRISSAVTCADDSPSRSARCRPSSYASGLVVNATATIDNEIISHPENLVAMLKISAQEHSFSAPVINDMQFRSTRTTLNETIITDYIQPGQAGYIGFAPEMRCFNGTLSTKLDGCPITTDNGTSIVQQRYEGKILRICLPVYKRTSGKPSRRRTRVQGKASLVTISKEEASKPEMSQNPYPTPSSTSNGGTRTRPTSSVVSGGQFNGGSRLTKGMIGSLFGAMMTILMVL